MSRPGPRAGAVALVALGALYLVLSLATGHSARAEVPPDLSARATDAALDVWKSAHLLVQEPRTVVLDVRPADAYARYHLPHAASIPGAQVRDVKDALRNAPAVLVYAGKDEVAQKLVAEVRAAVPDARVYYLVAGARAWYLAFQLPVPLFAEAAPPAGYGEALQAVAGWFAGSQALPAEKVVGALQTLARANYQPTLLKAAKKAAAGGGAKKIAGGCG